MLPHKALSTTAPKNYHLGLYSVFGTVKILWASLKIMFFIRENHEKS